MTSTQPDPDLHPDLHPDLDPEPDPDLDAAAARLRAWHAVERPPSPAWPGAFGAHDGDHDGHHDGDQVPADHATEELAARLRDRRSARHVAAAYSAVHGHPLSASDDGSADGRPRWGLGLRAAVAACVAVLLLAVGAGVVAFARSGGSGDVVPLAGIDEPTASQEPSPQASGVPRAGTGEDASSGASTGDEIGDEMGDEIGTVVVHVVGEVERPGLVSLPADARVADAIEAAGGTTRKAEVAAVNLARAVVDGEQILVPAPGEPAPAPGGGSGAAAGGTGGTGPTGDVLDLNTATAGDLETLPGVGPVLAERIVGWREDNGSFTSVDELTEVSGIGPSVLEQVRDLVRV